MGTVTYIDFKKKKIVNTKEQAYVLYTEACKIDDNPKTYNEAEKLYRQAVELDPDLACAWVNIGNVVFRKGNRLQAFSCYETAISIDKSSVEANYNLGFLCLENGEYTKAAEWFKKSIKLDPNFEDAHYNLAVTYYDLGDKKNAKIHFKKYLKIDTNGTWAESAQKYIESC
jgi:tetratricopeptide (TPR) repeat protein